MKDDNQQLPQIQSSNTYQQLQLLDNSIDRFIPLAGQIRTLAVRGKPLEILEAGCGRRWQIDLGEGVAYRLTGVDTNEAALRARTQEVGDIDVAVLGDLCTVALQPECYDVIWCSYVLEHINDVECVLHNFIRWLRPGGVMVLTVPNRDSVYGFVTRKTPFWFHVLYKKHMKRHPNAGKPGFDPFPTYYDKVLSRKGMRAFCKNNGLIMKAEYGWAGALPRRLGAFRIPVYLACRTLSILSLGRLTNSPAGLAYVIQKPVSTQVTG